MQDLEVQLLNSIDLEQISLSNYDPKNIEKFYLRKNFALALTKKKEPIYWGNLIEIENEEGQE